MRKSDVASEVSEKIGIPKRDAEEIIELIIDTIKMKLKNGEDIKITKFGNFLVRNKRARKGRNPRTGEEIGITSRKVVTFKASQIFKKYVNKKERVIGEA